MGLDISDLGTPRLSYRRLALILSTSPRESAFAYAVAGEAALWSHTDHLIADLYDLTAAAHSEKGKRPKPYPRPATPRAPRRSREELREFFLGRLKRRRG